MAKTKPPITLRLEDDMRGLIEQKANEDKIPVSEVIRKALSIGLALIDEPSLAKQVNPILMAANRVAAAYGAVRKILVGAHAILIALHESSDKPIAQKYLIKYRLKEVEGVISRAKRDRLELKQALKALRSCGLMTREDAKELRHQVEEKINTVLDPKSKARLERVVQMLTHLGGV